ncbi:class I tRNA ligase family protein [Rickettsiales bacterium]|nr:class I tRNA ligase family protein [Rickettsiales bacterium]
MKPLPQKYDTHEVESKWQKFWEENKIYAWDESEVRENTFVIDTPPPTVSGLLHMGHVFSYTQADFIARYQRMSGKTVFYPMGFDDNGLPTERLVEKTKKVRASNMSREDFIELCNGVSEEARKEYRDLFQSIALSVDWQQEYHTVSAESRKISQMSFLDLYNKGRAYRKLQPMLWDPVDQTAIAQAEIEDKEMPSQKNYLHFGLVDNDSDSLSRLRGRAREGGWRNSDELIKNARELRQSQTDVEKLLWSILRRKQIKGFKFRRQHPIEKYISDFACIEAKLIIELDGGQHAEQQEYDKARTEFFQKEGYQVLRFWNNDLLNNLDGVLETIWNALPGDSDPLPNPPPQTGEGNSIKIMTTRPELLGACVAVICHTDDADKYKGKMAVTPVFGVKVPIIADDKVDKEKGTGLVMCCTFGDETDIEWWREHDLNTRLILNKYGKIEVNISQSSIIFNDEKSAINSENTIDIAKTISAFEQIQNLKSRTTARAKMLELLAEDGAIFKDPETGVHAEPCAERSGSPLEILPTNQWFVKILDQKEELKEKAKECNWYPDYMRIRVDQWIDGLNWDWCISRQRYYGVPFPVWFSKRAGEEGRIIVADIDQLPVNPLVDLPKGYKADEVIAEADVMDTWATSSVSPQLSSKGISYSSSRLRGEVRRGDYSNSSSDENAPSLALPREREREQEEEGYMIDENRHAKLFPADLRPQAHEIIRTWAFYTIVKAHLHEDKIPWKNLMISGWCLASDKTKMSKSKGNVITPVDLVESKGSDVVRFWASTSRLGADSAYSEDVLKIGKKLVNKLWNATKFAAIHLDKIEEKPGTAIEDIESGIISEELDLWILTKLNKTIKKATQEFDKYEYCNARAAVEDFFWNDLCDNYLELVKVRVYGEAEGTSKAGQKSAVYTIYHCLDGILRLFAPIVPHVTDELYTHIFEEESEALGGSINCRGTWPIADNYPQNIEAEQAGIACVNILNVIRKMKAERNVSIKWPLNFIAIEGDNKLSDSVLNELKNVTNALEVVFANKKGQSEFEQIDKTDDGKFTVKVEFASQSEDKKLEAAV